MSATSGIVRRTGDLIPMRLAMTLILYRVVAATFKPSARVAINHAAAFPAFGLPYPFLSIAIVAAADVRATVLMARHTIY